VPRGFPYLSARLGYPEVNALAMTVAMTAPMVTWMRIRKHAWRLSAEMAGAMLVPVAVLIALCSFGVLPRAVVLPGTHLLMLPAMLGAMLYRWRAYTCHESPARAANG
jgi:peptidoglycan/LPS O-acetylase OafA/YrhL